MPAALIDADSEYSGLHHTYAAKHLLASVSAQIEKHALMLQCTL
jgi:hypothetical protein